MHLLARSCCCYCCCNTPLMANNDEGCFQRCDVWWLVLRHPASQPQSKNRRRGQILRDLLNARVRIYATNHTHTVRRSPTNNQTTLRGVAYFWGVQKNCSGSRVFFVCDFLFFFRLSPSHLCDTFVLFVPLASNCSGLNRANVRRGGRFGLH